MERKIFKIGLLISIIAMILAVFIGSASAEIILFDCPSDTDRETTQLGYAHSYFDSDTNTMIYSLDVANEQGKEILEYCVYPSPGFTGMTSDLTATYGDWSIDRPGTKHYFGFDSRSAPGIPINGMTDIEIGRVNYVDGPPSSELILLHISGVGWKRASTSPLPPPTATPTPTPTANETPDITGTATPTVTGTPDVTETPIPGDTEPPTKPLCPVAIAEGPTTISINWQPSTDNVGVMEYRVYRSVDNVNFYYLTTTVNTNYVNTGLTTGTTYYYVIKAFDADGNPSLPSDVTYATPRDVRPPVITVPSDIMAEATSSSGAIVTFSSSATDDIDGSILPECDPSPGSTFHLGLTTITCRASDAAGNIGSAIFTIMVVDTTSPTAPSGLVATAVSTSRIDLSWTASYDAVGVTQYLINRSTDGINFIAVGTTTGTTFSNTGLNSDTTYYYYIKAYDRAGNPSSPSSAADATTLVPIPPTPGPTYTPGPDPSPGPTETPGPDPDMPPVVTVPPSMIEEATSAAGALVTFSASAIDDNDGSVAVICNPPSGSTFPLGTTTVVCTASDSNNNVGSAVFTITVIDTTPPTPPSGLTVTAVSPSRIDLSWTASYDAVGTGSYWIFRSIDGTNFIPIRSITGTTFSNTGLMENTTYYYVIVAYDAASNPSDPSGVESAKTPQYPPNPPPTPGPTYTPGPIDTGTPGALPTDTPDPCSQGQNTPRGQTVEIIPIPSVGVRFDTVLQCGDTTAVAYYDNQWTSLPSSYKPVLFYDIDSTSAHSGSITITVTYSGVPSGVDENSLRLFHYENGNWVDITSALDTTSNTITGVTSSLSPFSIGGMGSGSGSGGSGTVMRGSSFDIIGLIALGICLMTISVLRLRKKMKGR